MTKKITFFEGCSWFKFDNYGLALGTNLKFYTSVGKGLKLNVRKFWGLIPIFVEVTGEKLFYNYVILELFIQQFNMSIPNVMMTKQYLRK